MDIAALIIAILALVASLTSLTWQLSKHFSTHVIQRELVDPFKDSIGGQVGSPVMDMFRELGDPIDKDELERIELLRQKKGKMT